jgi:hypothetical protein
MANMSAGQISNRLRAIEATKQKIIRKIRVIREQLKKIQGYPSTHPWVSFKRVSKISELRSPHRTLKDALRHDLLILKLQLRNLNKQSNQMQAAQVRMNFGRKAHKILKEAEKQGYLDQDKQEALIKESEKALVKLVGILGTNPSGKNIDAVLEQLQDMMFLGGDDSSSASRKAWQALRTAAGKLDKKADKDFRKNPKVENFDKILRAKELNMLLGGKVMWKPDDWRPTEPGTVHKVAKGDTLSGISQKYYKNPGYWDVIYLENSHIIGENPNNLKIGLELKIP